MRTMKLNITQLPDGGFVFHDDAGQPIRAVTTLAEAVEQVHRAMREQLGESTDSIAARFKPTVVEARTEGRLRSFMGRAS